LRSRLRTPFEQFRRIEPLAPLALATMGVIILSWGEDQSWSMAAERWQWLIVAGIGLLGLMGFLGLNGPIWQWLRATAILPAAWALSSVSGGTGSPFAMWFVAGVVVYALVLPERFAWWYPALAVGSYATLMVLPGSTIAAVEVVARSLLFVVVGYVMVELGRLSLKLSAEHAEAEAGRLQAEVRFQAAFATASSGMAITDLDLNIVQNNSGFSDFLGQSEEDLRGTSCADLLHPDDVAGFRGKVASLRSNEIWSFQIEVRFMQPKWNVVWGLVGASLVADASGEASFVFVHVQDITQRIRTEQQLRRSEEHYRNLFGQSPVPTWELDCSAIGQWLQTLRDAGIADLRHHLTLRPDLLRDAIELIDIDDVNQAAVRLFDARSKSDLLKGFSEEMLTADMNDAFQDLLVALWEGRDRCEARVSTRTVRNRPVEVVAHWVVPSVDDAPDLSAVVLALLDFTEYQRAQEALRLVEERLRNVVGAAPLVLFALDQYGVVTLAEGQGMAQLHITAAEMLGRSVFEMFRDSEQMIRAVRRGLSGEGFATPVDIRGLVFDIRFTPIWEGGSLVGAIAVAIDVTERKRASERLEELVRSKDEFVASVSHELRTPLTAVVGFAQELRSNSAEMSPEDQSMYIDLIATQAVEVADLIEDLLVAARLDVDKVSVSPEAVEIVGQVDDALRAWPAEFSKRVERTGDPAKAFADPIRVRQILRNLLTNAERYGGERVGIDVWRNGIRVFVRVRDDGPGVPEGEREEIFQPYRRANQDQGQPLSVGLGLTVSRQLARKMDGDLVYEYSNGWSKFELSLPAVE
jgi:PAS domain S-box-containing protein